MTRRGIRSRKTQVGLAYHDHGDNVRKSSFLLATTPEWIGRGDYLASFRMIRGKR